MLDSAILAAVKAGMKGELDSITVYEDAAKAAEGEVREFFQERAEEEKKHFNYLLGYYKKETINLTPERDAAAELGGKWKSAIVSEAFLRQVAVTKRLSAAVAAAIHLESDAIRLYRDWAARAEAPALKKLLGTLVEWEEKHYADLLLIQGESERYYFDLNRFEPF
ncbi:MAG TPA: ferritin family protein [Spirochaetia bacterium]|nr:ferritin family protein [Spirochaetales bacterium]HRY73872.1 ferritin family protein [Spirochaetia bacterium]